MSFEVVIENAAIHDRKLTIGYRIHLSHEPPDRISSIEDAANQRPSVYISGGMVPREKVSEPSEKGFTKEDPLKLTILIDVGTPVVERSEEQEERRGIQKFPYNQEKEEEDTRGSRFVYVRDPSTKNLRELASYIANPSSNFGPGGSDVQAWESVLSQLQTLLDHTQFHHAVNSGLTTERDIEIFLISGDLDQCLLAAVPIEGNTQVSKIVPMRFQKEKITEMISRFTEHNRLMLVVANNLRPPAWLHRELCEWFSGDDVAAGYKPYPLKKKCFSNQDNIGSNKLAEHGDLLTNIDDNRHRIRVLLWGSRAPGETMWPFEIARLLRHAAIRPEPFPLDNIVSYFEDWRKGFHQRRLVGATRVISVDVTDLDLALPLTLSLEIPGRNRWRSSIYTVVSPKNTYPSRAAFLLLFVLIVSLLLLNAYLFCWLKSRGGVKPPQPEEAKFHANLMLSFGVGSLTSAFTLIQFASSTGFLFSVGAMTLTALLLVVNALVIVRSVSAK